MKKLTLAVAGLLLISVVPTLVSADFGTTEFRGSIVLDDDDPVVSPISSQPTDEPFLELLYDIACANAVSACQTIGQDIPDVPDGEDDQSDRGAPTWLYIRGQDTEDYELSLTSNDIVVGTIDVYKYYPDGDKNTPECTTEHVTEIYPEEGQSIASVGYLTKLRSVTIGSHGVTAAGINAPIVSPQISLEGSQTGYIVVIDARAGTGATGDAALNYGVSTTSGTTKFDASHAENHWPQDPFTVVSSSGPCLQQGVPVPPLGGTTAEDIPGLGQQIGAGDLLGASLPEA